MNYVFLCYNIIFKNNINQWNDYDAIFLMFSYMTWTLKNYVILFIDKLRQAMYVVNKELTVNVMRILNNK